MKIWILDFLINSVPNIFEFIFNETRINSEAATRGVLQENVFLEISQNSQENNFIKKETLALVFSCEFCEISKNTFFTEHLWATAAVSFFTFASVLFVNTFIIFLSV